MTAVVTGAAGHLGANLVRELIARGREVRALVYRDRAALIDTDAELVRGDILDPASLREAFRGARTVFHLAAEIALPGQDERNVRSINVEGTRNVVEASLECGVQRLIHASSTHAYRQRPLDEPIDENRPLADEGECTAYERSKAEGERAVLDGVARGLNASIGIPSAMIGPYDFKPSHFGAVLIAISRRRLPAVTRGCYDWVDVRDVAEGLLAVEQQGRSGERYMLTGHVADLADLARLVGADRRRIVPTWQSPPWLALATAPMFETWGRLSGRRPLFTREAVRILLGNSNFDCSKAEQELGYRRRPLNESIHDTLEWFEAAGKI